MSRPLVAYFSASGTTEAVAKRLAKVTGAALYAIVPEKPYTRADVAYTNPLARCNREKIAKKEVPVAGTVPGFDAYDTVYLGFPIWYWGAPNVVRTFCGAYDWSGKRVRLFATSGGSDMGKTTERLAPCLKGDPEIVAGRVFAPNVTEDELAAWADA